MKKILTVVLAVALALCAFAGCAQTPAEQPAEATPAPEKTDLDYIKEKGKLVVGITEFEPMDYQEDGKWVGFDADMATKFAESLGVDVEFVVIDWDNKVFELNGKNIDCVWNGMTLNDEVLATMECSKPYCNNAQVVIVKAADADKYQTKEACASLKFAVEVASAGKDMAEENNFEFTEVADQATTLLEVASGTCDAAIIDSLMAAAMVGEGTDYAQLTYTVALNSEQYGIGFRKGSDAAKAVDEFFAAATADGTVQQVAEMYGVQAALIK